MTPEEFVKRVNGLYLDTVAGSSLGIDQNDPKPGKVLIQSPNLDLILVDYSPAAAKGVRVTLAVDNFEYHPYLGGIGGPFEPAAAGPQNDKVLVDRSIAAYLDLLLWKALPRDGIQVIHESVSVHKNNEYGKAGFISYLVQALH